MLSLLLLVIVSYIRSRLQSKPKFSLVRRRGPSLVLCLVKAYRQYRSTHLLFVRASLVR